jgi:hypothetical protein
LQEAFCLQPSKSELSKWPKNNHEYAPTQIGSINCWTLKPAAIERRSLRAQEFSKYTKKLRAVPGTRPCRSPSRQHRRSGELLPVCRTLFQIDAVGARTMTDSGGLSWEAQEVFQKMESFNRLPGDGIPMIQLNMKVGSAKTVKKGIPELKSAGLITDAASGEPTLTAKGHQTAA